MTPAARLQSAVTILEEIFTSPLPADSVISAHFRKNRYIGSKDRRAVTERLYRILRHYHRLSRHLPAVDARALVLADTVLLEEKDPRILFGHKEDRYGPDALSAAEEAILQTLTGKKLTDKNTPERIALECPEWAYEMLKTELDKNFQGVMTAMLAEAPLDLRVNILKTDRAALKAALEKETGFSVEETPHSPWGLRISDGRPPLGQIKLFQDGLFEVQDEGSQLVALAADAKPGMRVFDFCAGAGGKTLALGMMMQNKGGITAADISEGRLKRARLRFRRAGLHNIRTLHLSSESDKALKRGRGTYDIVLVDAPCTGTGTWRRDPDKKWRHVGPDLAELTALQARILDSAAKLVKPGGKLVYATCSLLAAENEDIFDAFLENTPDFTPQNLRDAPHLKHIPFDGAYLRLLPSLHKTDGFFCAIAMRQKDENQK
ncbi:MAG: RsmB/NOP family class I SAM-dependent RNA methyltransferase [Micavibrio sp.]|nr:MAG: RsmB/NOP family class I SAM-dependent RNA methyltransferase [Micavibrio sp.]